MASVSFSGESFNSPPSLCEKLLSARTLAKVCKAVMGLTLICACWAGATVLLGAVVPVGLFVLFAGLFALGAFGYLSLCSYLTQEEERSPRRAPQAAEVPQPANPPPASAPVEPVPVPPRIPTVPYVSTTVPEVLPATSATSSTSEYYDYDYLWDAERAADELQRLDAIDPIFTKLYQD